MRSYSWLVSTVAVLVFGSFAVSAATDPSTRVDRFLDGLTTMEAAFVQTVESDQGIRGPLRGTFYLKRPGRFRWEYEGDESQLIVADGKRIWLLDKGLEQVSHQGQKRALRGTPAQLLAVDERLETHFELSDGGEFDGQHWVELVPRDEESQFSVVRLGFENDQLSRLEMADKFGQYTRFVFADVKRNPDLDSKLFKFQPPPGWDVFQTH